MGPDGNVSKNSSGIIVGEQVAFQNKATRTLTFSSLNYGHEGEYTCRTKCVESEPQSFNIKLIGKNIIVFLHIITHQNITVTSCRISL